jgi:hypothetical protein
MAVRAVGSSIAGLRRCPQVPRPETGNRTLVVSAAKDGGDLRMGECGMRGRGESPFL